MKHKLGWGAILIAVLCAPMAFAQSYTDNLREGRDYILLDPPLPTRVSKGKIEVIEFFNFSCPHCFRMQGPFLRWMEENADNLKDVEIVYQPVPFQSAGGHYARAFHTMQALKVAKAFRGKFFNAIHRKRVLLNSQSRLVGWLGSLGLDVDRADKVYESFSVNSKLKRDERLIKAYGVNSTPQMSVAGKYVLSPRLNGSVEGMLGVVLRLVERERKIMQEELAKSGATTDSESAAPPPAATE